MRPTTPFTVVLQSSMFTFIIFFLIQSVVLSNVAMHRYAYSEVKSFKKRILIYVCSFLDIREDFHVVKLKFDFFFYFS